MAKIKFTAEQNRLILSSLRYDPEQGLTLANGEPVKSKTTVTVSDRYRGVKAVIAIRQACWFLATGQWPEGKVMAFYDTHDLRAENLYHKGETLLSAAFPELEAERLAAAAAAKESTPEKEAEAPAQLGLLGDADERALAYRLTAVEKQMLNLREDMAKLMRELGVGEAA